MSIREMRRRHRPIAPPREIRTSTEMMEHVGAVGEFAAGPLRITVKIIDSRLRFSRRDYLIAPVAGKGEQWVEHHRLVNIQGA